MAEALQVWPAEEKAKDVCAPECSDQELTRRAAAGDMQAFEEVYRRHRRLVYSLCLRMTQNVSEAEDIAQEVFVRLFRKIGSFRGEAAFTTWLHKFTANQVLMHFRKVKSRRELSTEDGLAPVQAAGGERAATRTPHIDRIALDRALAQLPPGYRMAFILHDVIGYEHEEIGRMLGVAVGTSKSQLHKARMRLRKLLTAAATAESVADKQT